MEAGQAAPAAAPQAPAPQADRPGIPNPVLAIQAILDAEKAPPQPTQARPAPAQEQVPAQPEANPEAEAPAGPNKQTEGDEATTEDARQMAEIPLDQLEAIELETTYKGDDGKDITEKLPVKALREGYMRQKDYQRKTAEVARQREKVAEDSRLAIEGERKQYQDQLKTMYDLVLESASPELKTANWDDLARNNAFEFVRLTNEKQKLERTLGTIQAKRQEVEAKQKAEQAQARQQLAAKAREQLEADIPDWNDAYYQTLMKAGMDKFGFKQEEVTQWVDPRAIKLLHKAYQFDQMQAEKSAPPADKRVVVAPKVVRPGPAQTTTQRQQQGENAMKQLRGSGRIEDAAAVIKQRFGNNRT